MELLSKAEQSPKDITSLDFAPRSKEEVAKTMDLLNSLEIQCILQRNLALARQDIQTTWMMENQRMNFAICRQAIKWALGLTNEPIFDAGSAAEFVTVEGQDG